MALTVINGTPPPDTPKQRVVDKLKAAPKPDEMLQCPRCASREVLTIESGVLLRKGKLVGGTKHIVCAPCFMNGRRVILA